MYVYVLLSGRRDGHYASSTHFPPILPLLTTENPPAQTYIDEMPLPAIPDRYNIRHAIVHTCTCLVYIESTLVLIIQCICIYM